MKNISPGLLSFMQSNTTCFRADLITITLVTGQVIRATTGQSDIVYGGNTFYASQNGGWMRGKLTCMIGLQADTMDLSVTCDSTVTILGFPYIQAAQLGYFDGAIVRVETLYMATYGDVSNGTEVKFVGEITNPDETGRSSIKFVVTSLLNRLDLQSPKSLIQAGCRWTLFDAGCTLVKASFAVNHIAQAGSTQAHIVSNAIAQASGYFDGGTIVFTSGLNSGLTATIKTHTGNDIYLNVALPFVVSAGDTFTVYPGCDKTQSTCTTKFSNLVNFGGFPYTPVPDTVV